jgi:tetratricopeptide (TPR) repeat protein
MAGARTFVVRFLADADQYKKGIKQVNDGMGGLKTQVSSLMPSFKTMAIAGAAAFGAVSAFAFKAVQAAAEDEKSQALLAAQLKRTFGEQQNLTDSVERYISVTQLRTGTSDTELRDSLGTLVRSTGNLTTSQNLLNVAQDVSAATGKDLQSVSLALAKASLGQFTALGKLGIPLDESTKKSKDFGKVLETLEGQFGGAADAAANTFGGKIKIIQGQFGEIVETIGAALLPYLDKFATFLVDNVAPAVQRVTTVIGEDGLLAGFQQLIFESGGAGDSVVAAFESMAVAVAIVANVLYKAYFLASAFAKVPFAAGEAAKDAYKALTGTAVNIDNLRASFDKVAIPINRFKTELITADQAERMFNKTGKITADTFDDDTKGSVAKAVKKATDRLKTYTDALKSSNSAQKAFEKSQTASIKAGESLTAANQGVTDAQAAFNQAVAGYGADSPQARKAAKELELAQRGLERAGYNVEGSLFAIKDAEEALKKVRADPESTPQMIREAEIALAEAKLSSADAIDSQTEATDGLTKATGLLNEAIFGVSKDSEIFKELSDALTTAKENQAEAVIAVAEAIERETTAMQEYGKAIQDAGKIANLYPVVSGRFNLNNPMAGSANAIPATVSGNSTGFNANGSPINVTVNAGMISDEATLVSDLNDMFTEFARRNGNQFAGFVGVR